MSDEATTPDPNEVLPGGLTRAAFLDLREKNPVLAARYSAAHKLEVTDHTNMGDARRRMARHRP